MTLVRLISNESRSLECWVKSENPIAPNSTISLSDYSEPHRGWHVISARTDVPQEEIDQLFKATPTYTLGNTL